MALIGSALTNTQITRTGANQCISIWYGYYLQKSYKCSPVLLIVGFGRLSVGVT